MLVRSSLQVLRKILASVESKFWHQSNFVASNRLQTPHTATPYSKFRLSAGAKIGVLAKIESADSVSNLEDVLDAVDGAMVARGDLGAELPVEQVPFSSAINF